MQHTLRSKTTFKGVGLHSGKPVKLTVHPAPAEYGVWFKRTDVRQGDPFIPANWQYAIHTPLCTRLENEDGVAVSTVEHLMAALAGCGLTNVVVELDGPEVPILDGSSLDFVRSFLTTGVVEQNAPLRAIEVLKTVEVTAGDAWARLSPGDGLRMQFEIDFVEDAIGKQSKTLSLANGAFVHHLCDSRTFCRNADVENMRAQGLALGGTFENAIVFDGGQVLSPGGLRHQDEPVRHKMLDAMGDLALAGAPILGLYEGYKAGHTLTNRLLQAVLSDPSNYQMVECTTTQAQNLPGAGVSSSDLIEFNT